MRQAGRQLHNRFSLASPFLRKAVAELDTLVKAQRSAATEKAQLLADVDELESIMRDRIDEIRARIKRLG